MESETFFFIAYDGNRNTIKVIDLAHSVSYQRRDWSIAVDRDFDNPRSACDYARAVAIKYNLNYTPFDSQYGDDYIDAMYLTLEEEAKL